MKCIIIEDQPPAQRILKKYITDYGALELVGTFSDALQALEFLKYNQADLMFLDIHLPKLSGMEFLRTIQNPPRVILTTAFPDFALESYNYDAVDYLLKPFSFARFLKAVSKVDTPLASEEIESVDFVFIKSGREHVKVKISDIQYIKSDTDYTEIYMETGRLLTNEALKHWQKEFHQNSFYRVHKSFLINSKKIVKITSSHVYLNGDIEIPIGRAYKGTFENEILKP